MKSGLEIDAPVTKELVNATALVIRAIALAVVLYGIAKIIIVVRWW